MYKRLFFGSGEMADNKLWVSATYFNQIVVVDLDSGEVSFLGEIAGKDDSEKFINITSCKYGDKVFFFDRWGKGYTKVDITNGNLQFVEAAVEKDVFSVDNIFMVGDAFLLMPNTVGRDAMWFDPRTERLTIFQEWNRVLSKKFGGYETTRIQSYMSGRYIWVVLEGMPYVIKIAVDDLQIDTFAIRDYHFFTVAAEGHYLLFSQTDSTTLILMDTEKGTLQEIEIEKSGTKPFKQYGKLIGIHGRFIITPFDTGNDIFVFCVEKNSIKKLLYPEGFSFLKIKSKFGLNYKFYGYHIRDNKIYLYPSQANMMLEINIDTLTVKGTTFYLPAACGKEWEFRVSYADLIKRSMDKRYLLYEGTAGYSLKDYIKMIQLPNVDGGV